MASLGNAIFKSKTGKQYRFKVFPLDTRFRKISGVYVIAYRGRGAAVGIGTRFSTWATPKTSRNRLRSTPKLRISYATGAQLHMRSVGRVGGVSAGKRAGSHGRIQSRMQ